MFPASPPWARLFLGSVEGPDPARWRFVHEPCPGCGASARFGLQACPRPWVFAACAPNSSEPATRALARFVFSLRHRVHAFDAWKTVFDGCTLTAMARGKATTVLATVLFTDIVASSNHAAEMGDSRWKELLARHHAIVRGELRRFGGREIDTAGDGFFATFERPAAAIRCACALSDAVRSLGIEVRAGVHVGECEVSGKKIGGIGVHLGARVLGKAGPGAVWISGTTRDLVAGSGFDVADRGVHQPKGIPGEWRLFEVTAVEGRSRPGRLDPAEARRLRDEIRPARVGRRRRRILAAAGVVLALAAGLAAVLVTLVFGSASAHSETVTFAGTWTGAEQAAFEQVIKVFNRSNPGIKVKYKPVGTNVTTAVASAVADGHPPDMADLSQPGFVKELARQGHLKPITYARSTVAKNFAPLWRQFGTYNGKLYAVVFKAANKSLLWYNVPAFRRTRATPPKTWSQLLADAKLLDASGVPAYSIGGADGWTLTDLFENIYLRTYGLAKYQALTAHKIKWTDPTVIHALKTMAQVTGDSPSLAGGTAGALQYFFTDSVTNAFSAPPMAAIVLEGDFVARAILSSTKAKPGTDFNAVPFPTITPGAASTAIEIGGDLIVTFRDTPAIEAFVKFLATAPAAETWARLGGFGTGNLNVPASVYPDAITRATELPLQTEKSVVFDMSDEQPAAFGSTVGQGEWAIFRQFLADPTQVDGIASQLEAAAAAAYRKAE